MVQFSWFFTVTEADTAIWGKKNLVIIKLPRIIHSQRDITSFFSFSPPSPDIHSFWSLFKVAFAASSSCPRGFCCIPVKGCVELKFPEDSFTSLSHMKLWWWLCDVFCTFSRRHPPHSRSAPSLFYFCLGSCRGESENGNAWSSCSWVRLQRNQDGSKNVERIKPPSTAVWW